MKINWKIRIKNKTFWISIIPVALIFIKQLLALAGINIDIDAITDQLVALVGTVFAGLGLLGIVADPTTDGLNDSDRAMEYKQLGTGELDPNYFEKEGAEE